MDIHHQHLGRGIYLVHNKRKSLCQTYAWKKDAVGITLTTIIIYEIDTDQIRVVYTECI